MHESASLIYDQDFADLKTAKHYLEKECTAVKITNFFGDAVDTLGKFLPQSYRESIAKSNVTAIEKSWEITMKTMPEADARAASDENHLFWVTVSGAIGGIGILTLFAELPVTTVLMLRAVADIAKDEGEDYNQFDGKIASLEVFALGGKAVDPETGETGYYAIRNSLEKPLEESSIYIAKKGVAGIGAPFAVQLIAKIAAKYQTIVSAQTAARAIPIVGAAAGAAFNIIFIDMFQDKARGHFIIRRLEKKYGMETVKEAYNGLSVPGNTSNAVDYPNKSGKSLPVENITSSYPDAEKIVRRHVWLSMGIGLIPVPIMDFAGISLIQLMMIKKLTALYEVPFSKDIVKNILSSLAGGAIPFPTAAVVGAGMEKLAMSASIAKLIPGIGHTIGAAILPISAGAATYAIGKVFIQHFESGGTLMSFEPEKMKNYYQKMFKEGKKVAEAKMAA